MSLEELEAEQDGLGEEHDKLQTAIRQLERQMESMRKHAAAVRDNFQKVLPAALYPEQSLNLDMLSSTLTLPAMKLICCPAAV